MNTALRSALYALTTHFKASADQIEKTIIGFGLFASVASAAAGAITAVGPFAATVVTTACVYAMYYKLANLLGVKISKNILKSIASAVIADIVSSIGVTLALAVLTSFVPVIGNLSSAAICAIAQFGLVYVAGFMFITVLNKLHGDSETEISEEALNNAVNEAKNDVDTSKIFAEAKQVHKEVKNNSEYKDFSEIEQLVNEAKSDVE